MMTKGQLSKLFQAIDAMDTEAFVSYLTDNAVLRYGSRPPVRGRPAVRDYVSGLFRNLKGLHHRLTDTWEGDESLVCEGEVTYTRRDGGQVTLPFVNVFRLEKDRIRDYLIYVDPSPLTG